MVSIQATPPATEMPGQTSQPGAKLGAAPAALRGWVASHRKQAILFASAAVVSLVLMIVTLWVLMAFWSHPEIKITPLMALTMLDEGHYPEAIAASKKLLADRTLSFEGMALINYVLGTAGAFETDERWEKDKTRSYLVAARYLEEAQSRGFPLNRKAEGTYQLGRCQFLSGQYTACRPNLLAALPLNKTRHSEIYRMLASAALADANPQLELALEYSSKYLESKLISNAAREAAWIERAQIYFRQEKMSECQEALKRVPENSKLRGDVIVLQGRMLMREAEQLPPAPANADGKKPAPTPADLLYERAIEVFKQAQSNDSLRAQATPKAMYLIGKCLHRLGRLEEARVQLDRTRQLFSEQPEGLAAGLEAADVLRALQQDKEAVAAYRREFSQAGAPETFSNPWFTLEEFRVRMMRAYRDFLAGREYERALELLEGFQPLYSRVDATELQAETNKAWGQQLQAQARAAKLPLSRQLELQAARQFRHAGMAYLQLARLRTATRQYPNDIWNSADNLLAGRDYPTAIRTLREYLKIELRARRAQALVALGKATLTLGEIDESIKAFQECLEYHQNDVAIFEARLWCSKAYQEKGELAKAEQMLRENLTGDTLTPASLEWRDSLFELGRLLNAVDKFQEAIGYLNEAIARYPNTSQSIEAQYLVAESYREAARAPQDRLQSAEIESVRVAQTAQLRELLEGALVNYKAVLELLNHREEESPLSQHESALLRNCYFSIGSVLFDMGRYEEAIKAYSNASTRYQNEPLVLEAFVQIANCHRRLHKPVEARGALEQAKVVWKRLPMNIDYTASTNHTRDEWQKLLDLLSSF